jgi:phosphoenolpyruvate---glycerone phosphotransferase subunit DhaL
MPVRTQDAIAWIGALQRAYSENRQYLTDLDAAIGDADHGSNMERGFTAARDALAAAAPADVGAAFQTVATTIIRTVGGASGPLFGTFFLRAAAACAGKSEVDVEGIVALFRAGIAGVQQRGKAAEGDKTMLDALLPALDAMEKSLAKGGALGSTLDAGAAAAESGMRATIPTQARKGRASYLGERSAGHQDPGATSACLLLRAAAESWRSLA